MMRFPVSLFVMCAVSALTLVGSGASALDLALPKGAQTTGQARVNDTRVAIPTGPYADGFLPTRDAIGRKSLRSFRIDGEGLNATQLIEPLRRQLSNAGYEVLLACDGAACGGFDFRFAIEVLPPPAMFVDLGDFSYLSAIGPEGQSFVTILTSRTLTDGFLQITQVTGAAGNAIALKDTAPKPQAESTFAPTLFDGDVPKNLDLFGHVSLDDLSFAPGTTDLTDGAYTSLTDLAAYLKANRDRRIALVGHTDAAGGFDINKRVSESRARAVQQHLIEKLGVAKNQIEAQGVAYLAPIATNLTEEGRAQNRRVEAVLISTE